MTSISKELLEDLEWIQKQMKSMGKGFDRTIVGEHLTHSIEFIKGVMWERRRQKSISRNTMER